MEYRKPTPEDIARIHTPINGRAIADTQRVATEHVRTQDPDSATRNYALEFGDPNSGIGYIDPYVGEIFTPGGIIPAQIKEKSQSSESA